MSDSLNSAQTAYLSSQPVVESEDNFLLRIAQECRRAERSRKRFVLVLVQGIEQSQKGAKPMIAKIAPTTRAIDTIGWYETDVTLGILFIELGARNMEEASAKLRERVREALQALPQSTQLEISAHIMPRDLNDGDNGNGGPDRVDPYLNPLSAPRMRVKIAMKRIIDFVGAASLLVLLAPVLAVIAIVVKLNSPGPVLFRQTRVGQRGKPFTLLKFRSMAVDNDSGVHENYVKDFIRGTAPRQVNEKGEEVFKLTKDSRVTRMGRFLRMSSLDELPQIWNVLVGEMSLVGPRPPISYEVEWYDLWHQRRVLEVKPGITGLWQVNGRSRVGFDDMVRLDLQYASNWSLWLDVKILLKTPLAIIGDPGAH